MPSRMNKGLRQLEEEAEERRARNRFRIIWIAVTTITFLMSVGILWNQHLNR